MVTDTATSRSHFAITSALLGKRFVDGTNEHEILRTYRCLHEVGYVDELYGRVSVSDIVSRPGHGALWDEFGLSYASWLVLPRAFMHAMPDEWQGQMAKLIAEFQATFDPWDGCDVEVKFKRNGKYVRLPDWSSREFYRYPSQSVIDSFRIASHQDLQP